MTPAKIDSGPYVPRIPPLRILGGIEANGERLDARAEVEWTDDQTRIAAFETPTRGFTLVNASITWRPLPETKNLSQTVAENKSLDGDAGGHASCTKDKVPLPGRDIRITARASSVGWRRTCEGGGPPPLATPGCAWTHDTYHT